MPIKGVMKKAEPPPDLVIDPAHELAMPKKTEADEQQKNQPERRTNDTALIATTVVVLLILLLALLSITLKCEVCDVLP